MVNLIPRLVTDEINDVLLAPLLDNEVKKAVFELCSTKTPGLDGFSSLFYQSNWDLTALDLCDIVRSFYTKGYLQGYLL